MDLTMRILVIVCSICLNMAVVAQYSEPAWHYTIDGFNDADITDLEVDDEGNTYASVNYCGALHLEGNKGRILPDAPHVHGVLLKLDQKGKLIWCHGFKSLFDNRINDLTLDREGNVYITGFGDGLMHFPGKSDNMIVGREKLPNEYHNPQGMYVAKYSKQGERLWVNYWSSKWAEGKSVAVNSEGMVVLSYYSYDALTNKDEVIDPFSRTPNEQVKVSLAYFQPDGKLISIQPFQILKTDSNVRVPRLRFDQQDNLFMYGLFQKSIQLSPEDSLTNDGYYDSWDSYLVKYNKQKELLWYRQLGGQNIQLLDDIDIADDGSVYGTGQYSYECILMDAIKPAQKSRFEYKSGNNFFYFHLFADGETDFIRYEEGREYNGSFMGVSIDLDVNAQTHIIGSFTDTLQIDNFDLQGANYPSSGFSSTWDEAELIQLDETSKLDTSWMISIRVRSAGGTYAMGSMFWGKNAQVKINGKYQKLSSKDYGRGSVIVGGAVRRLNDNNEVLAEQKESRRLERLESIESLFVCTSKKLAEAPTTWYPVSAPEPGLVQPGDPTMPNTGTAVTIDPSIINSPCGVVIEDKEASLFPNPTKGPATVKLKGMEGGIALIEVFSDRGQLIYSQRVQVPTNDYNVDFDMTDAAAGTYFVRITHEGFEKALRLVKMKI